MARSRLRFGYVIKCEEVIKDADGKVIELKCSHDPETRQGAGKKVKGIIHWLSESHSKRVTVNLYDRLFNAPSPGADHEDGDFLKDVNPESLRVLPDVAVEDYVAEAKPGSRINSSGLVISASTREVPKEISQ